jgi:hypothetical protein
MASLTRDSGRINGVYADAFRVFGITDNTIILMAAVYDIKDSTLENFTNNNGIVTFSEVNKNGTTKWILELVDSQIAICPENHSHNMVLITESQSGEPLLRDIDYMNGWTCDVCGLKPHKELIERYFCSTCIADVCIRCVGKRKQYSLQ